MEIPLVNIKLEDTENEKKKNFCTDSSKRVSFRLKIPNVYYCKLSIHKSILVWIFYSILVLLYFIASSCETHSRRFHQNLEMNMLDVVHIYMKI